MEEKSLEDKIKFWNKIISKTFPFIKKLTLNEEKNSIIFLDVYIDFFEFAKYINGTLRENSIFVITHKLAGGYIYLSIPFEGEDKNKVKKFQEDLNNFFNEIIVEHLPEKYNISKTVNFFLFWQYYEK